MTKIEEIMDDSPKSMTILISDDGDTDDFHDANEIEEMMKECAVEFLKWVTDNEYSFDSIIEMWIPKIQDTQYSVEELFEKFNNSK